MYYTREKKVCITIIPGRIFPDLMPTQLWEELLDMKELNGFTSNIYCSHRIFTVPPIHHIIPLFCYFLHAYIFSHALMEKIFILGAGTAQKMGVLGAGTTRKKGWGVLGKAKTRKRVNLELVL